MIQTKKSGENRILTSDHVRNFIFGVEDSLVSTVGLVSGVVAADVGRNTILLTGVILIFVEAFSMSVGSLLSDNSAREFESKTVVGFGDSVLPAIIMFVSYFLSGFIILAPYIFLPVFYSLVLSIGLAFVLLFVLGYLSARLSGTAVIRKGITMVVIGGAAVLIGVAVGTTLNNF